MKNKGGAPKKSDNNKLKYRKIISFNESEFEMLTQRGITDAKTLKTIVLNSLAGRKTELNTSTDPKFIFALNKIGNNLNQLAKKANSNNQLSGHDLGEYFSLIGKLQSILSL